MSDILSKIAAVAAAAVAAGADQTIAKKGGGDYTPPAEGPCNLRFIGYIECGKHEFKFKNEVKIQDKVKLVFELSGPNHQPRVAEDGTKHPARIEIEENLSMNEKARWYKLFGLLNHAGTAQHAVALLGKAYRGRIIHRKYAKSGEDKANPATWTGVAAELYDKKVGSYTLSAPVYEITGENGPTGKFAPLNVDAPISPLKFFLWNHCDLEQWTSLFIDGQYDERKDEKTGKVIAAAKSKNVFQNYIKLAKNFSGSPIHTIIASNGGNLDIPEAEDGKADGAAPDDHDVTTDIPTNAPAVVLEGAAATDALNAVV